MAGSIFDQLAAQADARREQHDRSLEPEPAAKAEERKAARQRRNGVVVNYTMTIEDRDQIKASAKRMGISASAFVRLACREYARTRAVEEHGCPLADAEARLSGD